MVRSIPDPLHKGLQGCPDLSWGILLDEVNTLHADFMLVRPAWAEISGAPDEQGPGLCSDEQLRDPAFREPFSVLCNDQDDVRRLSFDG